MNGKRAQVALEQLLLTGFVLLSVSMVFGVAAITYDENIQTAKANDALHRIVDKTNDIYRLGRGNVAFVNVAFPSGASSIDIVHKCISDSSQGESCPLGDDDINFSALSITLNYIGGEATIIEETQAKLALVNFPANERIAGSFQQVRIGWSDSGKVELRRV